MAESASLETRKDAEDTGGSAKYWQIQLDLAEQDHKDFLKDGKEVVQRYKGEKDKKVRSNNRKFNILFSNTETLKSAVFARMAKPDIRRRFADRDPVGKQIAEIIERSAIYCDDSYDAAKAFESGIEDYLLPGRGIVRVHYEAESATGEDGKEYVAKQELYDEYVSWDDYRHEPAKKWEWVGWEAFRHRMSRSDLAENFKELGEEKVKAIPLNWTPKADDDKLPDAFKRAEVWEIWDKTKRERVWVVNGYPDVLRTDPDPYGLEGFFPNAEPLLAVTSNDTLIPTPEFHMYRDQADGLDEIEGRIDRLTKALKRRGVYDATFKELAQLSKAADNQFVPVKNYAELSQKGGLAAAFQSEDIKAIAEVLASLHEQRDLRVQTIYEVVGIADIMRGSTDPRETLGAQKIKAQFGGNRLKKRQDKVQKWIRDTLRIKAEIIAEHFEPQKLAEMTGFVYEPVPPPPAPQMPGAPPAPPPGPEGKITPDMIKVLRSDKLRSYRIDIETDSTVFEDAESEKQATVEMLKAVSEFVTAWMPVLQVQPSLMELAFELLSFGMRHFKIGRAMEEAIEQAKMKLQQAAAQPQQPSPEALKAKAEMDRIAAEQQAADQEHQRKMAADAQKAQQDLAAKAQEEDFKAREAARKERELAQKDAIAAAEHARSIEALAAKKSADEHAHNLSMTAANAKHSSEMEKTSFAANETKRKEQKEEARAQAEEEGEVVDRIEPVIDALKEITKEFGQAAKAMTAPRRNVPKRGPDGKILHVDSMAMN